VELVRLFHLSPAAFLTAAHYVLRKRGEPPPPALPLTVDLVLAADCVYFEPAFPLLIQTLRDLSRMGEAQRCKTEILFCYMKRRKV
jgi:hypothetical protein